MRETAGNPPIPIFPLRRRRPTIRWSRRIVIEAGRTLGKVLANVCNWINPAGIILGGELGTAGQPVVDGIRESINRHAQPAMADSVKPSPQPSSGCGPS